MKIPDEKAQSLLNEYENLYPTEKEASGTALLATLCILSAALVIGLIILGWKFAHS